MEMLFLVLIKWIQLLIEMELRDTSLVVHKLRQGVVINFKSTYLLGIKFFLAIIFIFNCAGEIAEGKRKQCHMDNACHNAFLSCHITYGSIAKSKEELDAWCVLQVILCREFCERCAHGGGKDGSGVNKLHSSKESTLCG